MSNVPAMNASSPTLQSRNPPARISLGLPCQQSRAVSCPLAPPQVCSREVELEGLKSHLTRLLSGLDAHREAEQQVLAGHTARLSKEAARLEALQVNTAWQMGSRLHAQRGTL